MRLLAAALLPAIGCGPGARSQDRADAHQSATDATHGQCYAPSVMGNVMTGAADIQDCAVWNNVANMSGTVTLARTQNNLTMAFSTGLTFTGTIHDTQVTLVHWELHDFTDGCKWRATETLSGTIDDRTCVMMLHYDYMESVEIDNGGCDLPCSGTANFSLQISPIF
jgi:hypothetical protein